jgi:hypothetical protein
MSHTTDDVAISFVDLSGERYYSVTEIVKYLDYSPYILKYPTNYITIKYSDCNKDEEEYIHSQELLTFLDLGRRSEDINQQKFIELYSTISPK